MPWAGPQSQSRREVARTFRSAKIWLPYGATRLRSSDRRRIALFLLQLVLPVQPSAARHPAMVALTVSDQGPGSGPRADQRRR